MAGGSHTLSQKQAQEALDHLAQLRLRTAPHTGEARRLNTLLRSEFRLKRPGDALAAWEAALAGEPGDERLHHALVEWSLAIGLHAAINLQDPKATRRVISRMAQALPALEARAEATFSWARRGAT